MNKKNLALITFAHIVTDSYAGWIPVLLPLIIKEYGYSIGLAASFPAIIGFAQNFPQPFLGYYYDKTKRFSVWLAPLGASLFIGTFIFMPGYLFMLLSLVIGGCFVAVFHPEATHIARSAGKEKKELAVSIFLAGGTGGFALGALICGLLLHFFGKNGLFIWVAVGVLTSALVYSRKKELTENLEESHAASAKDFKALNKVPEFIAIAGIVTVLVSMQSAVYTFLPLYLSGKNFGAWSGGFSTFFYIIPGSLGGIVAGRIAKEKGIKALVIVSQALGLITMLLFVKLPYPWFLFFIPLTGGFILCSFPVLVSHSYKHLPRNAGFAGGAIIGLTWGIAGIFVQLAGLVVNWTGSVETMYLLLCLMPLATIILTAVAKI